MCGVSIVALPIMSEHSAVFETIGDPTAATSLVFSCEHASNALPEWTATAADAPLLADHWGWDIGAAALTRQLVSCVGGCAVLSRFSRLVCDPNRTLDDPTFVVECIDGHALSWNRQIDTAERARRHHHYAEPYHAEIDRLIGARRARRQPTRLCSIHSFTPTWHGKSRDMEIGVLFDSHEEVANRLIGDLADARFVVRANEPYSGYAGLIHAARRHGRAHDIVYVELEVRQDLIATPAGAAEVARRLIPAIERLGGNGVA
jgi:predicted N-formylglutamate amidohydrolase